MTTVTHIDFPVTLPPPQAKSTVRKLTQPTETQMESGRVRRRRSFDAPMKVVDVEWTFQGDEFDTFVTFFEDSLENGTLPFSVFILDNLCIVGFVECKYTYGTEDGVTTVKTTLHYMDLDEQAAYGQDFDTYDEGEFAGIAAGDGLTGNWIVADGSSI